MRGRLLSLLLSWPLIWILIWACGGVAAAADPADPPLDPLQQAIVDSLSHTPRTTPAHLLDAAIRTADIGAPAVALDYFRKLIAAVDEAGDGRLDLLADLGDAFDGGSLGRLERTLQPREPGVSKVVAAIREASRLRRRDPKRLAAAVAALRSDSARTRQAATDQLSRAGEDALPVLVELLQSDDPAGERQRSIARQLVRDLDGAARQPLLAWLGSDDVAHWPGVIAALEASGVDDIDDLLLAPLLVTDTPPAARAAALRALARRADAAAEPPSTAVAVERLTRRLDRVLSPAGLPEVDHLLLEPVTDPSKAAAAFGGSVTGIVERFVWNPETKRPERMKLPPRAARVQEALHLVRDITALDARGAGAEPLPLLARLEATLVFAGDPATALDRIDPADLRAAVSPPDGFDQELAADVLDLAVTRGMWEAAAAAAASLEPAELPAVGEPAAPLLPAARKALVHALAVPDAAVQFAAARALALAAGDPPYPGSSRVVDVLRYAATATGDDLVVVAHPEAAVAHELAADVSRFGYRTITVSSGRQAIFAAREHADTVLVLLAARCVKPSALETVQFLQQQGLGTAPPVLLIVDPLDDDGRGCFLQQLLLKFCDSSGVGIVDRLDSFFAPAVDEQTGREVAAPRFHDALAQVAGPRAVDPASREAARAARLERARVALALLGRLGRRGWDVARAADVAQLALPRADFTRPAISLLATIGAADAQQMLAHEAERTDLPADERRLALAAFATSVDRHGILLENREILAARARYNRAADAAARQATGSILEVLDGPGRTPSPAPADAAPARPTR